MLCGTGATSRVFRAVEGKTGRVVALKRLHRQLVRNAEALARLKRELEALSSLRHPSIVPVYDIVKWEGDPTLVMAFIDGEDLKERIVERGPLPPAQAEMVLRALFDALAAAHGAGMVHRDVKPQNVRLGTDGRVYLLDFGSARLDAASALTKTGSTVGTPEYMPPELFGGPVYDPRTDVYGVGATIYEALTGKPPQSADSLAELAFLRAEIPIVPVRSLRPEVPAAIAQVVDRCVAIRPEDRFATASLAVWALDHPEQERRFVARRAARPLCLHCHTQVPPKSRTCPSCKRAPFSWREGRFHVVLDAVEDAPKLLEALATISPEHGSKDELRALTQHLAALSYQKPRLVSFIDEEDARALVEELQEVGGHAHVEEEATRIASLIIGGTVVLGAMSLLAGLFAGALGGLVGAVGVIVPGALLLGLDRLASLLRARGSLLQPSRCPKSLWANLEVRGAMLAIVGIGLGLVGLWPALDTVMFPGASLLAVLSAALTALAAVVLGVPSRAKRGPVPTRAARFFSALSIGRRRPRAEAPAPRKAPSRLTAFGLAILLFSLVPYELFALSTMWESVVGLPVYASATWSSRAVRARIAKNAASKAATSKAASAAAASAAVGTVTAVTTIAPFALGGASPAIALIACARLLRRRRRVLSDGASIENELDDELRNRLAQRTSPEPNAALPARLDRLAQLPAGDPFVRDALVRATDLAHSLPPDAVEALAKTLEALAEGRGEDDEALVARCILETDPSHELRFKLLALEGELEARAASEWVDGLTEGNKA